MFRALQKDLHLAEQKLFFFFSSSTFLLIFFQKQEKSDFKHANDIHQISSQSFGNITSQEIISSKSEIHLQILSFTRQSRTQVASTFNPFFMAFVI